MRPKELIRNYIPYVGCDEQQREIFIFPQDPAERSTKDFGNRRAQVMNQLHCYDIMRPINVVMMNDNANAVTALYLIA